MPALNCPACERTIGMHELKAKTTACSGGFSTKYRCPFCRTDKDSVADYMA